MSVFDSLVALVLAHGYIVVFGAVALDCAALPVPGELLLLTLGGLAGQGHVDAGSGIVAAAAGVLVADATTYWVGRMHGQRVFAKVPLGRRWTPGITTLVFGRFVVGARMMVAPIAGARRLPFGRFVMFDALGAIVWAAAFVAIGYGAGANLSTVHEYWDGLTTVMQIAIALAVTVVVAVKLIGGSRVTLAVGATLLAVATVRPAVSVSDQLHPGTPRAKHGQAQVRTV